MYVQKQIFKIAPLNNFKMWTYQSYLVIALNPSIMN